MTCGELRQSFFLYEDEMMRRDEKCTPNSEDDCTFLYVVEHVVIVRYQISADDIGTSAKTIRAALSCFAELTS